MFILFSLLDLIACLWYRGGAGTFKEYALHFALGLSVFGLVRLLSLRNTLVCFLISVVTLVAFLAAYIISYQSEQFLGVPLHFDGAVLHLIHDKNAVGLLGDFVLAHIVVVVGVIALFALVTCGLYRLILLFPKYRVIWTLPIVVLASVAVLYYGLQQPKNLNKDIRLTFFFSWPVNIDLGGRDSLRDAAAARDELARRTYSATPQRTPTVVLLLADSLRADHFKQYGYGRETTPFLSSLYEKGELEKVEYAFSGCSESFCGITSTLGSKQFLQVSEKLLKVNELLARGGYESTAILGGDHASFAYLGAIYGSSFDHIYDFRTYPDLDQQDDEIIERGIKAIPENTTRPQFFYFFLMSAHSMGKRLPESELYRPVEYLKFLPSWHTRDFNATIKSLGMSAASAHELLDNTYDDGLVSADIRIQHIFERLTKLGLMKDALIFILGDHGDALGEHNHMGHTFRLYNEDTRIPLFIYDTARTTLVNDFFATQEDIAPTILDRVGMPIPDVFSGHSLYSAVRTESLHQTRRGKNPCFASMKAVDRQLFKYISCKQDGANTEEVYELTSDSKELHDIKLTVAPDILSDLRRKVAIFNGDLKNSCTTYDCIDG